MLVVWKRDRHGWSLPRLIETVAALERRRMGFRSLNEAIDTTTPSGRLVFHLFAALGQFERDLIRERKRAGLAAAAELGRTGGRRPVVTEEKLRRVRAMLDRSLAFREATPRIRVGKPDTQDTFVSGPHIVAPPGRSPKPAKTPFYGGALIRGMPAERGLQGEAAMRREVRLFYGVGAQKAGTTWLHRYCADHPELHAPEPKELDYWGTIRPPYRAVPRRTARRDQRRAVRGLARAVVTFRGVSQARADLARAGRVCAMYAREDSSHAAYLAALTFGMKDGQVAADISPQYAVVGRETFAEMAAMHPEARFVFLMREPAARLWSSVRHQKRAEIAAGRLDAAGVAAEYARVLGDPTRFSHMATDYARTLEELEAGVARDRILCLFYETLFRQDSADRITRFLGVSDGPADFAVVHRGERVDGGLPDALLNETRRVFGHVYETVFDRFGDAVPDAWRRRYEA